MLSAVTVTAASMLWAPAQPAVAQDPIFIGWSAAMPPLAFNYEPTSSNECVAGRVSCVQKTVRQMRARFDPLAQQCDHDAVFALAYLRTTEMYLRVTQIDGYFQEPALVNHEDAAFALMYFNAYDDWAAGRIRRVPPAWRVAFEASDSSRVTGSGSLLLGINAHINRDLPFVLAATGLVSPDGNDSRKPDHDKINKMLNSVIQPLVEEEAARFDPQIVNMRTPYGVGYAGLLQTIVVWRETAWRQAERLVAAPDAAAEQRIAQEIELYAESNAGAIVTAEAYRPPVTTTAARDQYCANPRKSGESSQRPVREGSGVGPVDDPTGVVDEQRVEAAHQDWASRLLGAGWLVGAVALPLLAGDDLARHPWTLLYAAAGGATALALLSGLVDIARRGVLDVVLVATTSTVAAAAVTLPEQRQLLAGCLVWAVTFACILLPRGRALLQVGYVVLVNGLVMSAAVGSGDLTAVVAGVRWAVVTAMVVTVALMVRQLREHMRQRTQVAEAVGELGHRALSVTEPDELLREALHVTVDMMGADYGTALRRLPDGRMRVASELGPQPFPAGTDLLTAAHNSYAQRIVQSTQPFVSVDLSSDERVTPPEALLRRGVISGLAVPVLGAEAPLGVLALHFRRKRHFTRDEVAAAKALAAIVATAWEQAEQRQTISHLAMHDSLTGLPNRALFLDRLEQALSRRPTGNPPTTGFVALLLIDLDDFKAVNDSLGHDAGDELLAAVASRFLDAVRAEDTVARLGGDEFAVLCERAPDDHAVGRLVRRVQAAAAEPLAVEGGTVEVTATVGVALGRRPRDRSITARTLLREADVALYTAKQEGRGRHQLFDEQLQLRARARVQVESELRRGIDRQEFVLHYQPIRSTADQRVMGVEALVRWRHPERGLLPPGEFISIAEQTGLIVPLGQWVLHTACTQTARWQQSQSRQSREPLWVAVNVSPRQLDDPDLLRQVTTALHDTGLAAGSLSLELTETALLDEGPAGLAALTKLRRAGAKLVLDDFGTGYSSLTHLTNFPIGALKIDRSFVAGLGLNARDSAVVSAVIALGSKLGVEVIAEGVETAEQLALLQQTGCYGVQGFLLDHPAVAPSLDERPRVTSR